LFGWCDARLARQALAAFDAAHDADPTLLDARVHAGDLFLDKYNAPDAKTSFDEVLATAAAHAGALLGLARVQEFEGRSEAMETARRALAANPALVPAHVMLGRLHLEAEAYDSATVATDRALAVDSSALDAWAVRAAAGWLAGDSAQYRAARARAEALTVRPADLFATLAEAAVRHRRYADGVRWAEQAVAIDPRSVRALGVLGTNQLRLGDISTGRATLERAFAADPYNVWHKNTLDLLDAMAGYTTIERGRFRLVTSPEEAGLMELYLLPLLEEAFDSLAPRYRWTPARAVRFEVFRNHADFSVRSVGLAGLGALGVSFGDVLAMDAPSARDPGTFNWGSTAWHELAHTFTLGASGNRVPRWLSEGLSVLEERRARRGWGATVTPEFLAAYKAGQLRPLSGINDGFVRPRYPGEIQFSYYLASLVCELLERDFGADVLPALLDAFRRGLEPAAAFASATRLPLDSLDARFARYMTSRFGTALANLEAGDGPGDVRGPYAAALRDGGQALEGGNDDAARAAFERAQALLPGVEPANGPSWHLARLALARGDTVAAIAQLQRITRVHESALAPNRLEADLHAARGDDRALIAALERIVWTSPYDAAVHRQLAEAAARVGEWAVAVRERRAVLATRPADPLEARYQLARALQGAGDLAAARREVLGILEGAPGFERAQALLLELRRPPGGAR
jgi:tetratricopeptide (TPR) repeat protein